MNILTLNAGSNSLKFQIVAAKESSAGDAGFGSSLVSGSYDDIGKESSGFSLLSGKRPEHQEKVEVRDHGHATELLFDWIEQGRAPHSAVLGLADIERIGHRVVHGADRFEKPVRINDEVIRQIEELEDLAPLHNRSALKVIRAAAERAQSRIPMYAVFDTVFHRNIPDKAALYGLPLDVARRHKIRRYGFHGISHRYMMLRYAQISRCLMENLKLITMHLEGGSSVAAIRGGQSVDTSMGFTPLEGLMMGTRSGDLDPAIVTYLMRKENLDSDGVENFLNKKCGLLGVSGISADTREIRKHLDNADANLAIDIFSYRVRKYAGAYLAVLNGADAVVVGGGIGENMPLLRERIFKDFDWCGARLDNARNEQVVDCEGPISAESAPLPIWVIPTEEGLMIAKEVAEIDAS